jgi:DNA-binding HxlR family transcriptional regulator
MPRLDLLAEATLHPATLSDEQEALIRELIASIADKWTFWTMGVLAKANGPVRFSRIMQLVTGVSQKSLTKTLRELEREGLVTRRIFAEVPPRVEYTLTPTGVELLEKTEPLWSWVASTLPRFQASRNAYDNPPDTDD